MTRHGRHRRVAVARDAPTARARPQARALSGSTDCGPCTGSRFLRNRPVQDSSLCRTKDSRGEPAPPLAGLIRTVVFDTLNCALISRGPFPRAELAGPFHVKSASSEANTPNHFQLLVGATRDGRLRTTALVPQQTHDFPADPTRFRGSLPREIGPVGANNNATSAAVLNTVDRHATEIIEICARKWGELAWS